MPDSNKTRILLITHHLEYSGAAIALLYLAKAMRKLGHNVQLASLARGPLEASFQKEGAIVDNEVKGRYDFIIGNTLLSAEILPRFRSFSPRIAAWIHESPTFGQYNPRLSFNRIPDSSIDILMGVAKFQVNAIKKVANCPKVIRFDNTIEIPEAINLSCYSDKQLETDSSNPTETHKIVLIGHNDRRKGFDRLVALKDLPKLENPTQILLIGKGHENLVTRLSDINLHNLTLTAPGLLTRQEVFTHLSNATLFASLSQDEVKPLTFLESLSVGVPIVASNIPAHAEMAEEFDGILVSKDPVSELVSIINGVKAIPDRPDTTPESLGRYSWDAFLQRTEMLLDLI